MISGAITAQIAHAIDSAEPQVAAKAVWQARGTKAGKVAPVVHQEVAPRATAERSRGGGSLSWRTRGTRSDAPVEAVEPVQAVEEQLPQAKEEPAVLRQPGARADEPIRRMIAEEAAPPTSEDDAKPRRSLRRIPVATSRSKIRDAVMQVRNDTSDTADDFKDPLDSTATPKDEVVGPVEDTIEPARPSDLSSEDRPSLRNDTDPFPDDQMPEALPDEAVPATPPRQGAPYNLDPSIPGPDSTVPDIESPATTRAVRSCDEEKRLCLEAIEDLRGRDIKKIYVGLRIEGDNGEPAIEGRDFPCECALGLRTSFQGRDWSPTTFNWKATAQCHKPLYFEDVALERYGHSWNPVVQPFMSAAHFFGSVPLLAYKMGLNPPNECMYTLGYYRPGNCAPYMLDPIPLSLRAGAYQALGVTGFVFWFWPPVSAP